MPETESTRPISTSFTIDSNPTLLIGLGGAGGQVVARVKKLIEEAYSGTKSNVNNLVNYLVIDADRFDRLKGIPQEYLDNRNGSEFLMISGFNPREAFRSYWHGDSNEDMQRWFPEDQIDLLRDHLVDDGASRSRPVGRFYLYHNRDRVRQKLSQKVQECLAGNPNMIKDTTRLRAIFICSCCGGTGSSTFLDMLYMLLLDLKKTGLADPMVEAVVMLPQLFISTATTQQPALEPYLKANAYAFFREVDYVLKNHDAFNEFAMDSISENRNAPPPRGNGLPEHMSSPLNTMYLLGEGIPEGGFGNFRNLGDLYDFASRAVFYTQFENRVYGDVQSKVSNAEALVQPENKYGRPTRYASLGFSEIRYPGELFLKFYELKAEKDFIECAAIGEKYPGITDDIRKRSDALRAEIADKIEKPLERMLQEEVDKAMNRMADTDSFFEEGGRRIDWGSDLRVAFPSAQHSIESGISRMDYALNDRLEDLCRVFSSLIDQETNSLSDSNGLFFLQEVLKSLNDCLEDSQTATDLEKRDLDGKADELRQQVLGGDENNPAAALGSIKKGNRHAVDLLKAYLDNLHSWVSQTLRSHKLRLRLELLRRLVGEKGKDHVPMVYNVGNGRFEPGTQSAKSILDKRTDDIARTIGTLREMSSKLNPEMAMRDYMDIVGKSPTTSFIPAFDLNNLSEKSESTAVYRRAFGFSGEGNDPDLQKLRRKFLGVILTELRAPVETGGLGFEITGILSAGSSEWYPDLRKKVSQHVSRELKGAFTRDVLPLIDESGRRDSYFEMLHKNSNIAARISRERYTNQQDTRRIQELHFLGGPKSLEDNKKIVPDGGSTFFETLPDRLVETRLVGIIPFWIFKGISCLERDYYNRDDIKDNLPHVDMRFNIGELDIRDPFGVEMKNPAEVFLKMQALSNEKDDPEITELLSSLIVYDDDGMLNKLPNSFIVQERSRLAHNYGINAIGWNAVQKGEKFTLSPTSESPVRIYDKTLSSEVDRKDVLRQYRKQNAILMNHIFLLDGILEKSPTALRALHRAVTAARSKYMKELANATGQEIYSIAVNQKKSARTAEQRVMLSNVEFYQQSCRILAQVKRDYEEKLGQEAPDQV
jgi:hypothetical protein